MRKNFSEKRFLKFCREMAREMELDELELAPLQEELEFIEVKLNPFSEQALVNCYICGRPLEGQKTNYDHVVPRSRKDLPKSVKNLVKTHAKCNSWKANRLIKLPNNL